MPFIIEKLKKTIGRLTIREKLVLTIGTGTLSVIVLTSSIALYTMINILDRELIDKGIIIATDLSVQSIEPIIHEDTWELHRSIKTIVTSTQKSFLKYIAVLDREGRILAHSDPGTYRVGDFLRNSPNDEKAYRVKDTTIQVIPLNTEENLYDISVPSYVNGNKIGVVRVGMTDREMKKNLAVIMRNIFLLAFFLSVVSIAFGIFLAHRITSPLKKMTENIIKISKGQLKDVMPVETVEKDEVGQMVEIFNEMAKNLKTQKEMDEYLARREKLAMIGELAANIAHEVKNPLTGIKLGIDTLWRLGVKEEILERLDKEIVRLNKVASRLLSFAQLQPLALQKTDIKHIVEEAMYFVSKVAEKRGIKMHCRVAEQDILVDVDADQVQQALLNIILNSIHATENGDDICISIQREGAWTKVVVSDTGKGILPDDLPRIFEPFYTNKPLSTGLGLAIAHKIITEHRGDIKVDSVEGEGTTVTITLPNNGDNP